MSMDKTIRRITDRTEQRAAIYRYWQSQSVGDRLSAVCDATIDAYAFRGIRFDDEERSERTITRVQRPRR